jgi:hypothetical protein
MGRMKIKYSGQSTFIGQISYHYLPFIHTNAVQMLVFNNKNSFYVSPRFFKNII